MRQENKCAQSGSHRRLTNYGRLSWRKEMPPQHILCKKAQADDDPSLGCGDYVIQITTCARLGSRRNPDLIARFTVNDF